MTGIAPNARKRECATSLSEKRNSAVNKMDSKFQCDIHRRRCPEVGVGLAKRYLFGSHQHS